MQNSANGEKKSELEITEINEKKIKFKTTYPWAFCLNANQEGKIKYYSLSTNFLNYQKLKKILSNCELSQISPNSLSTEIVLHKLRNYQAEDVNFLSNLKSVAIFSEMRTGKTPTALMIFKKWPVTNLLIIAPSILQQQWQRAVEAWLAKPAYIITYLDKEQRSIFYQKLLQDNEWIIIVSKDTFKIDSAYFKKLKKRKSSNNKDYCVIIDEAHFLRNHQSQQSKSIYVLRDAPYKMILTGTPIVNHHTDIFGILKFLKPEIYSSYWKFAEQYFYIYKTKFQKGKKVYTIFRVKGFKNEQAREELKKQIAQFSVNRRQKQVLTWLSPVIYQKEYLLMEEEQQKIYSQWKEKWKDYYQPLEILAKLKTLTLYPPALNVANRGSKIIYLINYLKERKEQGIIVFSTRSETFLEPLSQLLKEEGIGTGLITGKTSYQDKETFIDQFQNSKLDILLCNIQSAGVGLNLSRAETIIFADRSYAPADNEQAEARFLPTKDSDLPRVRLVIDLICKGTIDEKILKLLKKKEDIVRVLSSNPNYFFD